MTQSTEEKDRPTEWLRRLTEERTRYAELLVDSKSLALAAYRLARARCRVQPVPTRIPTLCELMVAAREINERSGAQVPLVMSMVLSECEQHGLTVIAPLPAERAA